MREVREMIRNGAFPKRNRAKKSLLLLAAATAMQITINCDPSQVQWPDIVINTNCCGGDHDDDHHHDDGDDNWWLHIWW